MLTIKDCIEMCRLTEDEIAAVAEHEHVPEMLALQIGDHLCKSSEGEAKLQRMIVDDIEAATARGDLGHAAQLRRVLEHFLEHHAGIAPDDHQRS